MNPFYEHPMATIINADCVAAMKSLPPDSIDLTVTSPPYDNLRQYNGYEFDFEATARELWRVTKQGGIVVWVVGDATVRGNETGTSFEQALFFKSIGFNLHDTMIYEKANPIPRQTVGINRYEQAFEYMFVFTKGKLARANIRRVPCKTAGKRSGGTSRDNHKDGLTPKNYVTKDTKIDRNIWRYGVGTDDALAKGHPARFPEALAEDHILSWSDEGDVVFDPFSGSGTTGKMAVKNGRRFIGSDVSAEYCGISKRRIEAVLDKEATA